MIIPRARWLPAFALLVLATAPGLRSIAQDVPKAAAPPKIRKVEDYAPAEEFVLVGTIKTHFVHKGDKGRPIVLIHGFGSNTYTWRDSLTALGKDHRVYALDLKGFGLTEKPKDGQYHLNAYADHLVGFLDAMKLERPILVGNSMGGAVALQVALQHPDRVGGLVLEDSATLDLGRRGIVPPVEGARPIKVNPVLIRAFMSRDLVERGLKNSFRDPKTVTAEMIDAYYIPTTIDGASEAYAAMMTPTPEAALPKLPDLADLKPKALIVWGRHDKVLNVALADWFEKSIPGARKVIFEGSGHLPHEEEPARFHTLIDDFVKGLP